MPMFYMAPRNDSFISFATTFDNKNGIMFEDVVYNSELSKNDDETNDNEKQLCQEINEDKRIDEQLQQTLLETEPETEATDWIGNNNILPEEEPELVASTPTAEFVRWHYMLSHMHF